MDFLGGVVMKSKMCCVRECKNVYEKRHRFPCKKYPDMFKIWLERIKPKNYEVLSMEEIYKKYLVCERHFAPEDIIGGRRGLKVTAVPCLHIPGFHPDTQLKKHAEPLAESLTSLAPLQDDITPAVKAEPNNTSVSPAVRKKYSHFVESLLSTSKNNETCASTTTKSYVNPRLLKSMTSVEGVPVKIEKDEQTPTYLDQSFQSTNVSLAEMGTGSKQDNRQPRSANVGKPGVYLKYYQVKHPSETLSQRKSADAALIETAVWHQSEDSAMSVSSNDLPTNEECPWGGSNDNLATINDRLCRICLKEKPGMWLFASVLTFDDQSRLDIVQAFQYLTLESTERVNLDIEHPKLPKHICEKCVNLLVSAYQFHKMYEETKEILTKFVTKGDQGDIFVSIPAFHDSSATESELKEVKLEGEEVEKNAPDVLKEINEVTDKIDSETAVQEQHANESEEAKTESDVEEAAEADVKLHRCPICLNKYTALDLKLHCQNHKALKSYLNAAPKFNRKVRFYARPRNNVCLFYRDRILHTCIFCEEDFEGGENYIKHVRQHRIEGTFRCTTCNRIFQGRNHLKMHELSHKKEAPFVCQECGKGFFLQKNLTFHMSIHNNSDDLPFKCKYCPRNFSNPEHLKRHTFAHERSISYQSYYARGSILVKCKRCKQNFKDAEALQVHDCQLCCSRCHKIFPTHKEFSKHVCKYKLKRTKCQPCGKVFQLKSSYKSHKYRCSYGTLCYICGKSVKNIYNHMLAHYPNRRKLYTCADCGKQFRYSQALHRHIDQVHLNTIQFWCQYCSKGFKTKWNLEVHERIHVGEKNHVCTICDKGFLEKSYLKKHLKMHMKRGISTIQNNLEEDVTVDLDNLEEVMLKEEVFYLDDSGD